MDNFQREAKEYFDDCKRQNIEVTLDIVTDYFKGHKLNLNPVKINFWDAYEDFLTAGVLICSQHDKEPQIEKKKLKDFETDTKYKITFESINLVFFDQLKKIYAT